MNLNKICFGVLLCFIASHVIAVPQIDAEKPMLNVVVIGSGIAGLNSAKNTLDQGYKVTVYEQTEQIGGIWFYTNETGKDKYGVNIHTSMYHGLRANSPHQAMEYPGFPFPKNVTPFPPQTEVLSYLHSYADHFDLKKHIKLSHLVIRVLPIENKKWEIIVKNLPNNTFETEIFDAVFVCNGHDSKPFYPNIAGKNEFNGKMIHSHYFRRAEAYRDEAVLVIGGGNSGKDLVHFISKTASRVIFSRHQRQNEMEAMQEHEGSLYSEIVTLKDDVVSFSSNGATFADGSQETFDTVIFATGYNYSFPFLSVDSGIHIENKSIQPLYMRIFNINHPTMAFIGAIKNIISIFDLQVRFALKYISGEKKLPSKSEMLANDCENCAPFSTSYPKMLSEMADIENIPDVLVAINTDAMRTQDKMPSQFRKYNYTIIDAKTFIKVKYED